MEELSRRSFPSENIETPNDTRDQNQNDRVEEPPNPPSRNQSIRNLGYIFRQRTPDDFNFEDLTSDFYRINNDDEETVVVEGKDELTPSLELSVMLLSGTEVAATSAPDKSITLIPKLTVNDMHHTINHLIAFVFRRY